MNRNFQIAVVLLLSIFPVACTDEAPGKSADETARVAAAKGEQIDENERIADDQRAIPALEERLKRHVHRDRDFLVVSDTQFMSNSVHVLSLGAAWHIDCGGNFGSDDDFLAGSLAIRFDAVPRAIRVDLTKAEMTPARCQALAVKVGAMLRTIISGV